jgi:hypothetical protein
MYTSFLWINFVLYITGVATVWLVEVASQNWIVTGISYENALLQTTSAYSGFSKKQYFVVLLTDSTGSILPGSEQYWYCMFRFDYKDMALT